MKKEMRIDERAVETVYRLKGVDGVFSTPAEGYRARLKRNVDQLKNELRLARAEYDEMKGRFNRLLQVRNEAKNSKRLRETWSLKPYDGGQWLSTRSVAGYEIRLRMDIPSVLTIEKHGELVRAIVMAHCRVMLRETSERLKRSKRSIQNCNRRLTRVMERPYEWEF